MRSLSISAVHSPSVTRTAGTSPSPPYFPVLCDFSCREIVLIALYSDDPSFPRRAFCRTAHVWFCPDQGRTRSLQTPLSLLVTVGAHEGTGQRPQGSWADQSFPPPGSSSPTDREPPHHWLQCLFLRFPRILFHVLPGLSASLLGLGASLQRPPLVPLEPQARPASHPPWPSPSTGPQVFLFHGCPHLTGT